MITEAKFGYLVIDGKRHTMDLKILPDRKIRYWDREKHDYKKEDIQDLMETNPQLLIVGGGVSGLMNLPKEIQDDLRRKNIRFIMKRNAEAIEAYNKALQENLKVAAIFPCTC